MGLHVITLAAAITSNIGGKILKKSGTSGSRHAEQDRNHQTTAGKNRKGKNGTKPVQQPRNDHKIIKQDTITRVNDLGDKNPEVNNPQILANTAIPVVEKFWQKPTFRQKGFKDGRYNTSTKRE